MLQAKHILIKTLFWQLLATILIAFIALIIGGKSAAISGFLGGFSVIFGAAFASLIFARNKRKFDAVAILVSLITAELVKLIFTFTFLFLVFKQYKNLVPAAAIAGLMVSAIVSGATISQQNK